MERTETQRRNFSLPAGVSQTMTRRFANIARSSSSQQIVTRRRFLQLLGGALLTTTATVGYSRLWEPRWVDSVEIMLAIPTLPPALAGLRLAQLSDIHLSPYTSPDRLLSAVEAVNRQRPNAVLITGDYVGDKAEQAEGLVEPLRRLTSRAFAVYGNHDLWTNRSQVRRYLQETPVQLLRNQAVQLEEGLWIAGVDDIWSGRPDLRAALAPVPEKSIILLMAHEPDYFDRVIQQEAPVAVQLSGHSHGGQVRLPRLDAKGRWVTSYAPILPRLGQRYPIGLRRIGQRQIYTNRGLGVWPLPFRFNCRPEITFFTLQPA